MKHLIQNILNSEEVTLHSENGINFATLNKWSLSKQELNVDYFDIRDLINLQILESTGGNWEYRERHYKLCVNGEKYFKIKWCIEMSKNSKFQTLFENELIKEERLLKLKNLK